MSNYLTSKTTDILKYNKLCAENDLKETKNKVSDLEEEIKARQHLLAIHKTALEYYEKETEDYRQELVKRGEI